MSCIPSVIVKVTATFASNAVSHSPPLGLKSTFHPDGEQRQLALSEREGEDNPHAVIRIHRVEVRRIGDADRHAEVVQFIDGTQSVGVVASEAGGTFDDHMREPARASITQQALIAFTPRRLAGEDIDILVDLRKVRAL